MGFDLIHSPSVSFDSLAPARLTPPGPTFGCSSSKVPTFPVVVNSAGFGVNAKFAGYRRCQAQRECPERFLHGIMWPMENYRPAAAALLGKRAAAVLFPKNTKNSTRRHVAKMKDMELQCIMFPEA